MARPDWRRLGGVVLFFIGATALYTFPLIRELRTAVMPGVGDYPSETALIAWTAQQLVRSPRHLFDTEFFYPHSNTQAYWQSVLVPGAMAAPVLALTGEPLLATNVVVFAALVLSGVLAFGLAYSLTGRTGPSLVAGVVFAYFPNRMEHLGTPIVQMGFLLPAIVWTFTRFVQDGRRSDLLLTVLGVWAQMLSSLYYGFALAFFLLGYFVAWVFLRPRIVSWRLLVQGAVGLVGLALLLLPVLTPYLAVHRALGFERGVHLGDWFGMDLLSVLDPGGFSTLYRGHLVSLRRSEGGLFPGFLVIGLVGAALGGLRPAAGDGELPRWAAYGRRILLAAAALCLVAIVVVPWLGPFELWLGPIRLLRAKTLTLPVNGLPLLGLAWIALEGRRGLCGPLTRREWVVTLLGLTVAMYLLTLTPTLLVGGRPWGTGLFRAVHEFVPGAAAFRAPGRWALVFVLPLALLAAFGADVLARGLGGRAAKLLPVLLLLGVMGEFIDLPIGWQSPGAPPPAYRWLARQPGDFAVVEFPTYESRYGAWAMFWATTHGKRLVNGAFVFVPPTLQALADAESSRRGEDLVALLQSIYPLRYAIVHRAKLPGDEQPLWDGLRTRSTPGVRFVRRFEDDEVFAISGTPQAGVAPRRWFSTDYVQRHPIAEYELGFDGQDPAVTRWIEVVFDGRLVQTHMRPAHGVLRLMPPYAAGDRNELRFIHRYVVKPAALDQPAYRLGRTSTSAPVDIQAVSAAKPYGNAASIRVNGLELLESPRRGYNVVALDPRDGRLLAIDGFDTFLRQTESRRLADFIDGLPRGTIVVAAIKDEGSSQLTDAGLDALRAVGARNDPRGTLFLSHVVIGVTGARPGEAAEAMGPGSLSASIGRVRPLGLALQQFVLR